MKITEILTGQRMRIGFVLLSILLGLLVLLLSGSLQIKQDMPAEATLDEFRARMDERIPALMKRYSIPGCNIALVQDGGVAWIEAYGYADVASGRPLTDNTPMSVQSITKSVTAWGVMRLAEKGLIDLDAPLTQYLRSWKHPKSDYSEGKITIRQLLSHTAGMPLGDFTDIYAPKEAMPSHRDVVTREAVLMREPGTGFSYSNIGYNLLELMIEDVTGQSFSEYIRTEILLPLGMETATFDPGTATPYPPTGYNLREEAVPVYVYPSKASGGLFATARDIARFAAAGLQGNSVLSVESISRMYQPEGNKMGVYGLVFEAYGFGHYLETLPNGSLSVSHGGQGNGLMTHFQAVPETGDAIVILTNSQRSWPFVAYLLGDWARWRGFPSVGMERIILGHYALCAAIGMLTSASLLMGLNLLMATRRRKRARHRLLRFSTAAILLGTLAWLPSKSICLSLQFFLFCPYGLGARYACSP